MSTITDAIPASHRDLIQARATAVLTTVDSQDRPQSTAVWYLVDSDGQLKVSVTSDRQKYRNLVANPQAVLFILDPANPYRSLEIRATTELLPDPEKKIVTAFATAYGVDEAVLNQSPADRYVVVLRPWRIVANPPATS
jgi:PPOX class probable F420-dependent enzyme